MIKPNKYISKLQRGLLHMYSMYCKLTNICVYACMYCINTIIDKTCEEEYIVMCINYILAITRMYKKNFKIF